MFMTPLVGMRDHHKQRQNANKTQKADDTDSSPMTLDLHPLKQTRSPEKTAPIQSYLFLFTSLFYYFTMITASQCI